MRLVIAFLMISLLSHGAVFGFLVPTVAAYYVDSVNGNDSNNGTAPASPFQTLAALEAADAITPLNHWRLVSGSRWREKLLVIRNNIIIESYGAGALPIVDASDLISAGSWTKTGGQTNVYQSANLPIDGASNDFVWAFENGAILTSVTSLALCDSTPASVYVSSETTSPITVYVHATGGTNPATNGNTYEYTRRDKAINSENDYTSVLYVQVQRVVGHDGDMRFAGHYGFARGTLATQSAQHQYYFAGGGYALNAQAIDGGFGQFVWYDFGTGYSGTCVSCSATRTTLDTDPTSGSQGFYAHTPGPPYLWDSLNIISSTTTNDFGCLGLDNVAVATVTNLTCTAGNLGVAQGDAAQSMVMTGGSISAGQNAFAIQGDSEKFKGTGITSTAGVFYCPCTHFNVDLENDAFTATLGYIIENTSTTNVYTLLNNTYMLPMSGPTYYFAQTPTYTSDFNAFSSNSASFDIGGTTYSTVAAYKTATGQDAHSTP